MTAPRSPRLELMLGACAVVALGAGGIDLAQALASPDTIATSDFAVFRAGGELVVRSEDPYDPAAQEAVMREILGDERAGGHLGFLLPPHAAVLCAPLALVPLTPAFWLFALLSAVLLTRLAYVLADLARADLRVVALVVCALGPVHATFRLGQLAILCALGLAELARALRDGRDVHAGVALAILTVKPQFVPIVAVYLAGLGRWRSLGAFALAGAVLAAPSLVVIGPGAWLDWASGLGTLEDAFAVATPPYMVNARGTLARWLGDPARRALATSIAWALFALAGAAALALARRARRTTSVSAAAIRSLPLVLALGLLASPHAFFHDLLAWSVPIALARGFADASQRRRWDILALGAPTALLFASAVEPALGVLLPIAPQLAVPLCATWWLVHGQRST